MHAKLLELIEKLEAHDPVAAGLLGDALESGVFVDRAGVWPAAPAARLPLASLGANDPHPYLPIEWLREQPDADWQPRDRFRSFQSSGTTATQRSRSHFSERGLELYRAQALVTFAAVMEMHSGKSWEQRPRFSLIPSVEEWPDSSLAQMVAWIGEIWPLEYVTGDELRQRSEQLRSDPIWLFGTGFHFVELADHEQAIPLHRDSIIIETGGTKGRTRKLDRQEYFALLTQIFGLSHQRIISEYGMCELATQAWDFTTDKKGAYDQRRFRFPGWVRAHVMPGPRRLDPAGKGAMTIADPLRPDYPWPLRTQDLVTLDNNQSFTLHGRVQNAPLKGCSLKAEELLAAESAPLSNKPAQACSAANSNNLVDVLPAIHQWWKLSATKNMWAAELQNSPFVALTIDQLTSAIPSKPDWENAIANSELNSLPTQGPCLFVLPSTHSAAALEPLAIAAACGKSSLVRIPDELSSRSEVTQSWIKMLRSAAPTWQLEVVGSEFMIGQEEAGTRYGSVVAFGSDETIAKIKAIAGTPVCGFGSKLTASLASTATINEEGLKRLTQDAFTLNQMGCRNARFTLFLGTPEDALELAKSLSDQIDLACLPIAPEISCGLESNALRFQSLGWMNCQGYDGNVLIPVRRFSKDAVRQALSATQLCLPILIIDDDQDPQNIEDVFSQLEPTPHLVADTESQAKFAKFCKQARPLNLSIDPLGQSQSKKWAGRLDEVPLFRQS